MAKSNVLMIVYDLANKNEHCLILDHFFRFPHVRLRLGRYEYEDRKLLCIAAMDFYHNVSVFKKTLEELLISLNFFSVIK